LYIVGNLFVADVQPKPCGISEVFAATSRMGVVSIDERLGFLELR
jgi:hypothetical protein